MSSPRTIHAWRLGAAGVGAALLLAGLAGPAGAHRAHPPCPRATLCVWADSNFEGKRIEIDGNGVSNQLSRELDNEVTSVFNRRSGIATLFDGKNAEGPNRCFKPKGITTDLGVDFTDVASSTKLQPKLGCPA